MKKAKQLPKYKYEKKVKRATKLKKAKTSKKLTDIHRRSNKVITESHKHYKILVENSIQGIVVIQDFRIVYTNAAFSKISGFSIKELLSLPTQKVIKLVHPEDQELVWGRMKKRLSNKSVPPHYEFRGIRKDGTICWLEMYASQIEYNGKPAVQGAIIDITHRKIIESALEKSKEKYGALVENLNVGVYRNTSGPKGRFIEANPALVSMFGYNNKKDFLAIKILDLYQRPKDWKSFNEKMKRDGFVNNEELYLKKKDGTPLVGSVSAVAVKNEKDKVIYFDGIIEDITDRKKSEESFKKQGYLLNERVKELNCLLQALNFVNKVNAPLKEIMHGLVTIIPPAMQYPDITCARISLNDLEVQTNNFKETKWKLSCPILIGKQSGSIDVYYLKEKGKKGKESFLHEEKLLIKAIAQRLSDMIERKRAVDALKESEKQYRGLYENSTIGIYRTTPDGKILMANPALLSMLGYSSLEEFASKDAAERSYADKGMRDIFKKIIQEEEIIYGFEADWKKADGTIIKIRESARAVKDQYGNIMFYEGTLENITEIKIAELALIEAKEKAEKSDKLKSEFIAQMSHEIRTPINVIVNFTNLLRGDINDNNIKDISEGLDCIALASRRIVRTIELILNMSEIATGNFHPEYKLINIYYDILLKLEREYRQTAELKNLEFTLRKTTSDTITKVDEYSVYQIFNNLLDNAFKYTQGGTVEVNVFKNEMKELSIEVQDTGIGISENFVPSIFDMFTQEDMSYSRNQEGIGLGLALVKKYCDLNNAEIKAESLKGKGTRFIVTFKNILDS